MDRGGMGGGSHEGAGGGGDPRMISLANASRWYGSVIGINDVTCQVGPGLTALLGPNGAGKSTMLKLVTGQLRPTSGTVKVLDEPPFANRNVFRRLGYCPESESSYDDMTGRDVVTLMAAMSGIASQKLKTRVSEVIERVGMTANANRKIGGYSKGMKQRIKVAQSLVHDPDVLILDEPLNGLDPASRHEMSALFAQLAGEGKCLLVSSHILYEVEQMTRNILLIHRGRLLAQGDVYHIRSLIDTHPHRISITSPDARRLAQRLLERTYVLSARLDAANAERLEIETGSPDSFYSDFPGIVMDEGFQIRSFDSPDNNLEAVFRYLVKG
jgi:ABC-2 type transport system ATP-binding protein